MVSDITDIEQTDANVPTVDIGGLVQMMQQSKRTSIFSGAGMSTESGLLDFRSEDRGMWNGLDPIQLASTWALNENTEQFTKFYRWRMEQMFSHQPNIGHRILAEWESTGLIQGIITQNVESYHEQAGSTRVIKLHGDLGSVRCVDCGSNASLEKYLDGGRPSCTELNCNGLLRPNVVLFGESLPQQALTDAAQLAGSADLLIVLGSSLTVSPANFFPRAVKEAGGRLVIINYDPTPLDGIADLVFHQRICEVLQAVHQAIFGREVTA